MTRIMPAVLLLGLSIPVLAACGDEDKKLKVTNLDPDYGDAAGGAYVTVRGNRFLADGPRTAKVYFGTTQGSVVQYDTDHSMTVRAPSGEVGKTVDVLIVFEPGGEIRIKNAFKFIDKKNSGATIDDIAPKK
ncbi:MAG: IPT/TIG domain-containing protein [Kofleriaceae bacterium]